MKIIRRNFLTLKDRTFSFDMTDHLDPNQDQDSILTKICKGTTEYYKENVPIWARTLGDCRIFPIPPEHQFFSFLDKESRKSYNFVIFRKKGQDIIVEHFGPFGQKKTEKLNKIKNTYYVLKKLTNHYEHKELQLQSNTRSEEEKKKDRGWITQDLKQRYLRCVQNIASNIESTVKKEVTDLINRVFEDDKETADDLIKMLTTPIELLTKTTAKTIGGKVTLKIGATTAARIAAKCGAKGAAKVGANALTGVGAVVGLGDVAGVGLEVASGEFSCVPGGGTAGSLVIDFGIAAWDIKLEIKEYKMIGEDLKAETERIQTEFKDLRMQYDQAIEENEFVKEVLEDPGFKIKKLEQEISILDDILEKVDLS